MPRPHVPHIAPHRVLKGQRLRARLLAALVAPEFHILHADALNGFNAPPGHHTPGVQRPSHLIVNAHMAFVDALGDAQQLVDLFFLTAREAVDAHLPPGIQRDAARAGHLEHIIQLAHGLRQRKSTHVIPRHARKVKQRAEGIVVLCVLHALCRYCVAGEIQRDVPACEHVAACEIHICAEYDARYAPVRHQRVQRVVCRDVRAEYAEAARIHRSAVTQKPAARGGHARGCKHRAAVWPGCAVGVPAVQPTAVAGYKAAQHLGHVARMQCSCGQLQQARRGLHRMDHCGFPSFFAIGL